MKIEKVMLSTTIRFNELFKVENGLNENDDKYEEIIMKKEFKELVGMIRNKISELLNI
jgi:hypothetical protein